jgi:hypothetical protein
MHTSFSPLRLSAGVRLAYVTSAVAMLWLCVLWALT